MAAGRACEVSVILTFTDHEEWIGRACLRVRSYLREHGLSCEILAVDEGAGDNSQSVLALLMADVPELRVLSATGPGYGYALAAAQARGRVLFLVEPAAALSSLAAFPRAYRMIDEGQRDLVQLDRRFLLLRRTRTLKLFDARGRLGFRRLVTRAHRARLRTETPVAAGTRAPRFMQFWRGVAQAWVPRTSRSRG